MPVMYTDNAFDTAVFDILLDPFGVKVHNLTHIGDSQGLGGIESLNNVAQQVILEAESKGASARPRPETCTSFHGDPGTQNSAGLGAFPLIHIMVHIRPFQ